MTRRRRATEAGQVALLDGHGLEDDRVVLLLSDVTEKGALVLVLAGRVATKEPGRTCWLKGLTQFLRPL